MSQLKIIAGQFKGYSLQTPDSNDVRPTLVRARKALLDSLGDFDDFKILDLCAGVGTLGLEIASRGAAEVVCVEKKIEHCDFIKKNFAACSYSNVTVINQDVRAIDYSRFDKFDLIFADPPYALSGEIFVSLTESNSFKKLIQDSKLIWELPSVLEDVMLFYKSEIFRSGNIKICGGTKFLFF